MDHWPHISDKLNFGESWEIFFQGNKFFSKPAIDWRRIYVNGDDIVNGRNPPGLILSTMGRRIGGKKGKERHQQSDLKIKFGNKKGEIKKTNISNTSSLL
jgi:hypothetical protein